MIEYINSNSGLITIIFSAIVAISTVVYAVLTWRLVSETILLRKAQTEPHVFITIIPHKDYLRFLNLIIKNIGMGPAYDIKFNVITGNELFAKTGKKLKEVSYFESGIGYMAPQQKIEFFLGEVGEYIDSEMKSKIEILVSYKNAIGENNNNRYILNVDELTNYFQMGEPSIKSIEKHLKVISESIYKFSLGWKRIKVETYTSKDREDEQIAAEERHKSRNP